MLLQIEPPICLQGALFCWMPCYCVSPLLQVAFCPDALKTSPVTVCSINGGGRNITCFLSLHRVRLVVLLSNLPSRALPNFCAGVAVTAHARAHGPRVGYMIPSFARQMQESSDKWDKSKDRETIGAAYSSQKGSDPTGAGDAFTYDSSEASGATYNGVYYNDGKCSNKTIAAAAVQLLAEATAAKVWGLPHTIECICSLQLNRQLLRLCTRHTVCLSAAFLTLGTLLNAL
jgi:hypothetical protein